MFCFVLCILRRGRTWIWGYLGRFARARARFAREIPLVSKCVRLIGRRGTRARISRVHSRLPRIITHAWICRRLLRPPPRHTASPPRTQAVCGRRNCIPLFFLVFPWNLQVTAKVVDRRRSSSCTRQLEKMKLNIQVILYILKYDKRRKIWWR